jgi:hypothetical protein
VQQEAIKKFLGLAAMESEANVAQERLMEKI